MLWRVKKSNFEALIYKDHFTLRSENMMTIPAQIAMVARRMFERKLLDIAGGNITARDGSLIYSTPRYSGSLRHWQLDQNDILAGLLETDELLDNPQFSREGKAHLEIYHSFPSVGAVIHAHPFHILPFCVAERPIEPCLEATQKFGVVEVVPRAPAHSTELAKNVVNGLKGKEEQIRIQAAAVLLPKHGIIVAGKDLLAAVDAVERIDWNAYCLMAMKLFD
jgi:L-fuculose-phosphate aldolase